VLTGEGSDEMMAGYERYYKTLLQLQLGPRYHGLAPGFVRRAVAARVAAMPPASRLRHKLSRTFLCLEPDVESLYFDNFAVFNSGMQRELLTQEARARAGGRLDPYAEMRRYFESAEADSLLDRMLYADTKTYLHELLMKQDQMSMAASIESRVPFLDHKLVEYTARLPRRMKLRGARQTKYVLRRAMKGVLPESILTRGKMGFPVPVGKWFRGEYRHLLDEYVLSERAAARGVFEPGFVRRLVARHLAGEEHTERLWALVNFEMWQRRFFDGEEPTASRDFAGEAVVVAGA
jgi:asparagine synthase (glutamine-hydrolysing)